VTCDFVKYLGIQIDCHLTWKTHETTVSSKLCRALGMLSKIRHFVDHKTLIMIYYGIFSSILMYSSLIWGQNNSVVTKLQILQNKALRIINFQPRRAHASPLYRECKVLKLRDNISLQNFIFAHDSLNKRLPSTLNRLFTFVDTERVHNTRNDTLFQVNRLQSRTVLYGSNSIKSKSIDIWNYFNLHFKEKKLYLKSRSICKNFVTKVMMNKYEETNGIDVEIRL